MTSHLLKTHGLDMPSGNQAELLPTSSTSTMTQACASTQTLVSSTHSPPAARSPSLDARNSQSPSNAHTNSTPTQTQPQIIGSPQQLLHPRRGRSQVGEPSRGFSGSHSQPILITQLQPTSTSTYFYPRRFNLLLPPALQPTSTPGASTYFYPRRSTLLLTPATLVNQLLQINSVPRPWCKQHCVVEGCPELIAPSMWKSHMTLHAQGVFPREIPST